MRLRIPELQIATRNWEQVGAFCARRRPFPKQELRQKRRLRWTVHLVKRTRRLVYVRSVSSGTGLALNANFAGPSSSVRTTTWLTVGTHTCWRQLDDWKMLCGKPNE